MGSVGLVGPHAARTLVIGRPAAVEVTVTPRPWRVFPVEVARVDRLGPTFARVTFHGGALESFADNGFDQRIKLILPAGGAPLPALDGDWYQTWRALPDDARPVLRTYTVRAVRPGEVDVDFALHGDAGPATRWALSTGPGDRVALLGPDSGYAGVHGGIEFQPPTPLPRLLLVGDETAVPAVASILARLPGHARGQALLEVPDVDDATTLAAPPGIVVTWLARGDRPVGARLVPAVAVATADYGRTLPVDGPLVPNLEDVDVDRDILWEVPRQPAAPDDVYAWLAGEAAVIRMLRRHLVCVCRLDRRSVAFMGYWRLGRPEPTG